jgi:hypothetical protein
MAAAIIASDVRLLSLEVFTSDGDRKRPSSILKFVLYDYSGLLGILCCWCGV